MANATEDPAVAPTTATTTTSSGSTDGATSKTNPNRRRIIKAATPKASTNGDVVTPTAADTNGTGGNDNGGNDDNNHKIKKAHSGGKKEHELKPLVVDDPEETTDEWRNERLKATEKRGKALREKELARRRATPSVNNDTANATANPFSRFLSVFSVEPEFPEHKRSLETGKEVIEEGPSGKRLKPSDTDVEEPNGGGGSAGGTTGIMSKAVWVAAALAVAVGVAIALQRGRKK